MMQHFDMRNENGREEEKWAHFRTYVFSRIKALYPLYLISIIGTSVLRVVLQKWSLKTIFVDGFYEIFMLQETGLGELVINNHLWFVSALFLASIILAYFLIFHMQFYLNFLAPVLSIAIPAAIYRLYGNLISDHIWGILRAACMLSIGCLVYQLYLYVGQRLKGHMGLMGILECAVLALVVYIMWGTRSDYRDFVVIPFWAVLVLLLFLKRGLLTKSLDNKVSCYLGSLSYAMYVCQHMVIIVMSVKPLSLPKELSPVEGYWIRAAVFLGLTILLAAIAEPLSKKVTTVMFAPRENK